ncbi:MAG: hypothetical protein ACUVQI_04900 [Thermochromatium sp.]
MRASPYWISLIVTLLLLSALWGLLFWFQLGHPVPSTRWMAEAYALKQTRAAALPSPKVVILAGSNALFSLDSGLLEAAWGWPVVNLGVNAALGLDYILHSAEPYLNPGDLVLMPLEYPLYQGDTTPSAQLLDYVIGQDPDYWRSLPLPKQVAFVARLPAARLIAGLRRQPDPLPPGEGLYGGRHLDARGDYIDNDPERLTPAERAVVAASHAAARAKRHTYGRDDRPNAPGWHQIRAFQRRLQARGITLWLVPPTLMDQTSYHTDPHERRYYETLPERVRALGVSFFGEPQSFMYAPEDFFDTPYHLTAAARVRHTQRLIALLPRPSTTSCPDRMPATLTQTPVSCNTTRHSHCSPAHP